MRDFESSDIILDSLSVLGNFFSSLSIIYLMKHQNSLASFLSGEWHWPPWSIARTGCCCTEGGWTDSDNHSTIPTWRSVSTLTSNVLRCESVNVDLCFRSPVLTSHCQQRKSMLCVPRTWGCVILNFPDSEKVLFEIWIPINNNQHQLYFIYILIWYISFWSAMDTIKTIKI